MKYTVAALLLALCGPDCRLRFAAGANGPTADQRRSADLAPLKADAALSGELGYTFGQWMLTSKDETGKRMARYGVYVTVWKRQRNGKWRFVLDGGNSTGSSMKQ